MGGADHRWAVLVCALGVVEPPNSALCASGKNPLLTRMVGRLGCSSPIGRRRRERPHFVFSFCVSKFFHCPKTTKTLPSNPSIRPFLPEEDQAPGCTRHRLLTATVA
jgi:hypothetical protein